MEVKLYVANLAVSTTEEDLRLLFAQAGNVTSVDLIKDRDSGQPRGFAFVTMNTQAQGHKAIEMFNVFLLAGRPLKVSEAKLSEARGGYQSRLRAGRDPKLSAFKPGKEQGGYRSKLSAFGDGSGPVGPRRRGGSQRY